MWMVVYIAQTKEMAEKIKSILQNSGLLVKLRAVTQSTGDKYGCYEVLVPDSELDEAHGIIIDRIL